MGDRKGISPAWALLLVAPVVGELISGATPPAAFLKPFPLIAFPCLYGGGSIICRELTHRWGKGWPTLLLLGAAYGVLEEGIVCASFFNAHWPGIGALGAYGRWLGVNWVWSMGIIVYHSAISIGVSVLIVSMLFPQRRADAWVGRRTFVAVCILYVVAMALLTLAMAKFMHFPPQPVRSAGAFLAIALFGLAARHAPRQLIGPDASGARCVRPVLFGVLGFLGLLGYYLLTFGSLILGMPAVAAFFAVPAYVAVFALVVWLMSGRGGGLGDRQMLALATGPLLLYCVVDVVRGIHKAAQPSDPTGLGLVALSAVAFLAWLNLRTRRRVQRELTAQAAP
jgi:hypothetical protein